jgi:predicted nuclease of predicted toxin-antitoxin system
MQSSLHLANLSTTWHLKDEFCLRCSYSLSAGELSNKSRSSSGSKSKDIEIARYADSQNQIVVTKDEDFENLHFGLNTPKKLISVLLGNISTNDLITVFEKHLVEIEKLQESERFYIEIGKNQFTYTTEYTIE